MNVIPICLHHHPLGPSIHTHTNTKIFKKQSITSEGHRGDYLQPQNPVTRRCRNLEHVFLGRSHTFLFKEEMELDEMLPKR